MARVLIIANRHGFHSDEVRVPKKALERSGHIVKLASTTRSDAVSSDGASFSPDFAYYEINPDYFDAVIVVGSDAGELGKNETLIRLLRKMTLKGKAVCGITMGPLVLAAAGLLTGKRATVYPDRNAIKALKETNARYEQKHVVCDGNIITGDDPESSEELVGEMIKILG